MDSRPPAPKEDEPCLSFATVKNPEYLAFLRSRPCILCFSEHSEPHHVFKTLAGISYAGIGLKGSDFLAIPVCRRCHTRFHNGSLKLERSQMLELIIINIVNFEILKRSFGEKF